MTMVSTGPISLGGNATSGGLNQSVNIELGRAATASINMNESAVRGLAGVPSGAITMNNFYGKSNDFPFTISSDTTEVNLRSAALSAGWDGTRRVVCTINSGVTVYSNSTGSYAMTINGSFPNGVLLINNGTILGRGGNGGLGGAASANCSCGQFTQGGTTGGSNAGPALLVSVAASITNNNRIAGGGGGGGGGGPGGSFVGSGGGGGGGIGNGSGGGIAFNSFCGGNGVGSAGTLTSAGAGGSGSGATGGGGCGCIQEQGGAGGPGGSFGSSGTGGNSGGTRRNSKCNTFPYNPSIINSGGAGGAAVVGNSNITWNAFGTRNGSIS
jgi:hypothetical protein